jgi:hypothetical protein
MTDRREVGAPVKLKLSVCWAEGDHEMVKRRGLVPSISDTRLNAGWFPEIQVAEESRQTAVKLLRGSTDVSDVQS